MTTRTRALAVAGGGAVGVLADQALKLAAVATLSGRPPLRLGIFQLRYVENRGAVLSLGAGLTPGQRTALFTVVLGAVLAALVVYAVRSPAVRRLELWAVILVASGGFGNIVDRVALGYVRDYVLVGLGSHPTAAFNLADVAIYLGGGLLLLALWTGRKGGSPFTRP